MQSTDKQDKVIKNLHCEPVKISMVEGGILMMEAASLATPTTLAIKNLPSRCTVWQVLDLIQDSGFQGWFEYLYMPMKPKIRQNRGYAFVAFEDAKQAAFFQQLIDGLQFHGRASSKSIGVEVARAHVPLTDLLSMGFQIKESQLGPVLELDRH